MFGNRLSGFDAGLFDELRRFEGEVDRLLGRQGWPTGIRSAQPGAFPQVNVGATPERVDVYLFVAGLDPSRIDLTIQRNVLVVSGIRRLETAGQADYYRRERFDGDFRRVVTLPEDVDPERVDATYRDGVLQVTVQRREASRPRQITVD